MTTVAFIFSLIMARRTITAQTMPAFLTSMRVELPCSPCSRPSVSSCPWVGFRRRQE
jgi:hypothetical protein